MKQRVITAVIALIIFIPLLYVGGMPFAILATLLGLIGISEILVMKKKLLVSPEAILAFLMTFTLVEPVPMLGHIDRTAVLSICSLCMLLLTVTSKNRFSFDDAGVLILGSLYVGMGFHYMIMARDAGLLTILYAFLIVWLTDSGAYLIGRKIGKHKLAPHVSPNKTWEGSIGGTVLAVLVLAVYLYFFSQRYSYSMMLLLTLIFSVGGQLGDLVESALKRHYGVKDSGKILPGHGGILDRFDSIMFILPIMFLLNVI